MFRFFIAGSLVLLGALVALAAVIGGWGWWILVVAAALVTATGIHDVVQRRHSVLRNYPVLGHLRYLLESIRPELQQYFIERNFDGRPYDRDTRSAIYERAKGIKTEQPFGTERDVYSVGYEYLVHSVAPVDAMTETPSIRIGGPDCTKPYRMALFNVSAMSFGSLSGNAITALNRGAARGGVRARHGGGRHQPVPPQRWRSGMGAGVGVLRRPHPRRRLRPGGLRGAGASDQVRMVSLKVSQGAKPGIGGVLPGAKVTPEIAAARDVPVGEKCVSPAYHRAFSTPRELVHFLARLRALAGGKPVGVKLCVGSRQEFLAICKAILAEGVAPDFVIVDGAEGGTGAAPLEYEDHVGMALTEGLMTVHNALVGAGLRDRIRLGASGKVSSGVDVVKRMIQGADYTNGARAMMMAVGCIQAQTCHTNTCPVGVATQDPKRVRALDVADKTLRVQRYQEAVVQQAVQVIASMGLHGFDELAPHQLRRRVGHGEVRGYDELFDHLRSGELVEAPPATWAEDWQRADPDRFRP